MPLTELRATTLELRVDDQENQPPTITGLGAVFFDEADPDGSQYRLWTDIFERMAPTAFDAALAGTQDVRSLFNHNPDFVLGRVSAGTLKLSKTAAGLVFTVTPPDTQTARDQVLTPIRRGDVSGASIMFIPTRTTWTEEVLPDGRQIDIRTIEQVDLWEIGPVTFPAYKGTTAGVQNYSSRSASEIATITDERNRWRKQREQLKTARARADFVTRAATI